MSEPLPPRVVIVDYGLGNLYSVRNACLAIGLVAEIHSTPQMVAAADGIVLPGIGAFGDAMRTLHRLDLVAPLRDAIAAGRPVMGICLGMQLLLSESYEFGRHDGLGVIEGTVEHFGRPTRDGRILKVPHIGWNRIQPTGMPWTGTGLEDVPAGAYMYFVHSYYVRPADPAIVLSTSSYGDVEFCSAIQVGSLFACQFHPERSGSEGLDIYRNLRAAVVRTSARVSA